jgi:hypothetical protein
MIENFKSSHLETLNIFINYGAEKILSEKVNLPKAVVAPNDSSLAATCSNYLRASALIPISFPLMRKIWSQFRQMELKNL